MSEMGRLHVFGLGIEIGVKNCGRVKMTSKFMNRVTHELWFAKNHRWRERYITNSTKLSYKENFT